MAGKKKKAASGKRAVSFNLDEDVARSFRSCCILSGKKPAEVVESLVREYTAKRNKPQT